MEAARRWRMLLIHHCEENLFEPSYESIANWYRFVKILVIEIFSSVLGLFGLIIGLLVSSKANEFE